MANEAEDAPLSNEWQVLVMAPVPASERTKNFIAWEDASMKANWIIRGRRIEEPPSEK